MRNTFNLVWRLLLIAAIAGLALGLVNEVTKEPIARQSEVAADASRFAAYPDAASFLRLRKETPNAHEFYSALDANGNVIGFVASSREYGYHSEIEVVVGMDMDFKIVGVVIGANGDFSETAGLGAKVKDAGFAEQFIGLVYDGTEVQYNSGGGGFVIPAGSIAVHNVESEGSNPDAVSGATFSSNAVITAFNNVASALHELIQEGGAV